MPIGRIRVRRSHGEPIHATLTDEGGWECPDKQLENYLTTAYPLSGWWVSPSMGKVGAALLHEAAKAIGGEAEYLAPIPPHNPNVIY